MIAPKNLQSQSIRWIDHDWSQHPADGLTPARLAMLLRDAEQGDIVSQADLFCDIEERDLHIQSELNKRRREVAALSWSLVPPRDATPLEKENTEKLQAIIEGIEELPNMLYDLTDAIGKGFSAVEMEWQRQGGVWLPAAFHFREQRLFKIVRDQGREHIHLNDMSAKGQPLQPMGWIVHTAKSRSGSLARVPLFRSLAFAFLFKSFALGDWAEFLEVYGYPIRLGKYGPTASAEEKQTLFKAVVDIGRRAGGIIPENMSLDLLDAVTGDPEAFSEMVEKQDKYISTLILAGTLTSQADGKSSTNALGNVHEAGRIGVRNSDAKQLDGTISRDLVLTIGQLNGLIIDPARKPRWQFDTAEPEDIGAYAEALPKLVGIGMQIDRDWAHERLRIPKAASAENALRAPTSDVSQTLPQGGAIQSATLGNFASAIAARAEPAADQALVDQLENEAAPLLGDWLASIRQMVERAKSMEALRDQLLGAYGHLPSDALAAVMETGFALQALRGMVDVRRETNIARPAGGGAAV